jgi:hypothetical protein
LNSDVTDFIDRSTNILDRVNSFSRCMLDGRDLAADILSSFAGLVG